MTAARVGIANGLALASQLSLRHCPATVAVAGRRDLDRAPQCQQQQQRHTCLLYVRQAARGYHSAAGKPKGDPSRKSGVLAASKELHDIQERDSSAGPWHASPMKTAGAATVAAALPDYANHHRHHLQPQPQQLPSCPENSFRSADLEVVRCSPAELRPKPPVDKLLFGHVFTDHMFRVDWDQQNGWSTPLISKLHNLDLHPAAKVLHYALEAFEGAKAYRGVDNKIRFFRLDQNVRRLRQSVRRLALPDFDEQQLIECIHRLVQLDHSWIPSSVNLQTKQQQLTSLYIRPTVMGVEPSLGVAGSKKAILYVLLSPAGPYFKTGFKPISLYADPSFVRAWPGGAGNSKLGSNYAPTIMAQKEAERLGLQQVLWLYDHDMKLTEVGTMNVFVAIKHRDNPNKVHLVTPPLSDGLILPGITRDSILELARQWDDVEVEERYVTISELAQLIQQNRLIEMFGAGTACIVCPISSIQLKDGTQLKIPHSDITRAPTPGEGPILTRRILKTITDIQYGRIEHPWARELLH